MVVEFFRGLVILLPFSTILVAAEPLMSVADHLDAILPSVVQIKAQKSETGGDESELISTDSGGTGFVLDETHHIVTNAHVIGDAKKIAVVDQSNTEHPATLIGKDDKTDIALLEVAGLDLPALKSTNSTALKVGDGVFVIGFPFSLGHSVSVGITGGMNRFLPNYPYMHYIQTDAAINPGNSGGPMFNYNGELVGMVSTYFSRQGGYTNIAFAIPIEEARRIAEILVRDKKIQRGYLGAELLISEKVVRKMGQQSAVLITRIDPNSPAASAGLKAGDLIVGINNAKLKDSGELHRFLERSHPDDDLALSLLRNGQAIATMVRLGITSAKKEALTNVGTGDQAEKSGLILRENGQGLEVNVSYTMAKTVGFTPNDKILRVNGTSVKTIKEFNAQLSQLKENDIALVTVQRNGQETFILPIGSKTAIKGYSTRN